MVHVTQSVIDNMNFQNVWGKKFGSDNRFCHQDLMRTCFDPYPPIKRQQLKWWSRPLVHLDAPACVCASIGRRFEPYCGHPRCKKGVGKGGTGCLCLAFDLSAVGH